MSLTDVDLSKEELLTKVALQAEEIKSLKSQKKFGLVWEDKPDAQVLRVKNETPVLREDTSRAVVTDEKAANHILINGDNFHALTALLATHTGKVDVIYIDPPYNTGTKDFIYNDNYLDKEDNYRHSKWLSFMEKRLSLAHELMKEDGLIVVAIGDEEHHRLRLLMDEIFGSHNFIANLTWQGGKKNDARFVSQTADYMLIYSNNLRLLSANGVKWRQGKTGVQEAISMAQNLWSTLDPDVARKEWRKWLREQKSSGEITDSVARFNRLDDSGSPINFFGNLNAPGGSQHTYEIIHPITGKPCKKTRQGWRYNETKMNELISKGRIWFGESDVAIPRLITHLEELSSEVPSSVFQQDRKPADTRLLQILGKNRFPFPKDHEVIMRWLKIMGNKNSLYLDFFAGSGTTAHAVAELNKQDGGNRQCILVTDGGKAEIIGESSKNAKKDAVNIAEEVTYERVRRVLTGKDWADGKEHEPLGGNLRYFKVEMEQTPHGVAELDQRLALEKYTIDHAKIATNIFNEVASKNEFDAATLMTVDYRVYADEAEGHYLVGVNAHDHSLVDLEEWFKNIPATAMIVMVGKGLEEIEWVRKNSDRIKVDDVLGRVIHNRKYVASQLPLV